MNYCTREVCVLVIIFDGTFSFRDIRLGPGIWRGWNSCSIVFPILLVGGGHFSVYSTHLLS